MNLIKKSKFGIYYGDNIQEICKLMDDHYYNICGEYPGMNVTISHLSLQVVGKKKKPKFAVSVVYCIEELIRENWVTVVDRTKVDVKPSDALKGYFVDPAMGEFIPLPNKFQKTKIKREKSLEEEGWFDGNRI